MKKLTFITLVLILGIGLAPLMSTQPTARAQDGVAITFVHIYPDERDVRRETIQAVADAFTAQTGVTVNIESTTDDYNDVFEGAIRALEQGNAPHVIQAEDSLTQIAIDSQAFVKISDYATDEQKATISDIVEPMRNYYQITPDDFWGLPWNASNPVMYYNPDMFTAAGLDPENPPRTFEEITAACDVLMNAGIESLSACVNWPLTSWMPEQWVSMQGGMMLDNENGRSARATETLLDSPEMLAVLTWWKSLADKGYYTYTGTPEAYTPEGLLFVSKKTAIHISTSAAISNLFKFAPLMGQFTPRVAPLPLPTDSATNGITAGGAALWVLAGHSDEETRAAVDFVFFLINTENMAAWHKASGYFPIRQSAIDLLNAESWFEQNPAYAVPLNQLLESLPPNPSNAGMRVGAASQVRNAMVEAIQSIVDGGEDPAAALAAAKQRADKAIQEYNGMFEG